MLLSLLSLLIYIYIYIFQILYQIGLLLGFYFAFKNAKILLGGSFSNLFPLGFEKEFSLNKGVQFFYLEGQKKLLYIIFLLVEGVHLNPCNIPAVAPCQIRIGN